MLESLIFYPSAIAIIVFALCSIFSEKVVYSLLWAISVFFVTAVIFYLVGAEYNAVVQLAVYGLAVPIMLALALMFTSTRIEKNTIATTPRRYIIFFAIGLILLSVFYLVMISLNIFQVPIFASEQIDINSIRMFDAITNGFLKNYLVAFELVSALLFVVVVGVSDNAK